MLIVTLQEALRNSMCPHTTLECVLLEIRLCRLHNKRTNFSPMSLLPHRRTPATVKKLPWLTHHLERPLCGMHLTNWLDEKEPYEYEICWKTCTDKDLGCPPCLRVLNHLLYLNQPSLPLDPITSILLTLSSTELPLLPYRHPCPGEPL